MSLSTVVVDTAKFKLVVAVPAVHAVVPSMVTVAEAPLWSYLPLPIGEAKSLVPVNLPLVAFTLVMAADITILEKLP